MSLTVYSQDFIHSLSMYSLIYLFMCLSIHVCPITGTLVCVHTSVCAFRFQLQFIYPSINLTLMSLHTVPLPPERLVIQEGSITDRTATVDVIYNASLSYTTEWRVAYGLWSSRLNNYITKSVAVTEANLLRLLPGKKYSVICYGRTTGRLQSQATTSEITFTTSMYNQRRN